MKVLLISLAVSLLTGALNSERYFTRTDLLADEHMSQKTYLHAESVRRICGDTRFKTSLYMAEELRTRTGRDQFDSVILASGKDFPDALTGGYLSMVKDAPIILTAEKFGSATVYEQVNAYVKKYLKPDGTVYVLGGESAVSAKSLSGLESFHIERIAGENRFETNIDILKEAGVSDEDILICTGYNYADSLSCSAAGKPILLVNTNDMRLTEEQTEYLLSLETENYYIIGGKNALSEDVEEQLSKISDANIERIGGQTRFETSTLAAEKLTGDPDGAVLVYSHNFPDGLCAGLLAATYHSPVILTKTGSEQAAAAYAAKYGIHTGYISGGFGQINDICAREIFGLADDYEIDGRIDSGFFTENGYTYYYDAGKKTLLKGDQFLNGGWYYFDETTGAMHKGFRWIYSENRWVYYSEYGQLYYGWAYMDGSYFYFEYPSGTMYTGKKTIDGINFFFEDNGRMVDFSDTSGYLVVANKKHKLPSGYEPSDLSVPNVPMNYAGTALRYTAARALEKMFAAAKNAGITLILGSGYRSESYQRTLYNGYVAKYGTATADTISSRPGYSDHQTGLAADISDHNGATYLTQSMENTAEGIWLRNHAHEYGFIMRYPKGKDNITGYSYEPWHFRYVGVDYATKIYNMGVWYTFEEYFGVEGGGY